MSDNTPKNPSAFATWLPLASLALSAAAFSLGAPAALARSIRPSIPANFAAELETAMLYEPVMFPMPALARRRELGAYAPLGTLRGVHDILGRAIASTR